MAKGEKEALSEERRESRREVVLGGHVRPARPGDGTKAPYYFVS